MDVLVNHPGGSHSLMKTVERKVFGHEEEYVNRLITHRGEIENVMFTQRQGMGEVEV